MSASSQDQNASPDRTGHGIFFEIVRRSRVMVLLAALLLQIALSPLTAQVPFLGVVIHLGLVMAVIYSMADDSRHLKLGMVLGVPGLILLIVGRLTDTAEVSWLAYFFILVLYLFLIRLLLTKIFLAKTVTLDTIGMALCTYILLGALWMLFYLPIHEFDPGAFHFSRAVQEGNASESLTYFSYVTLTTLGYGDTYPISPVARSFAILEALTGTLFLAVLISRLVGKYAQSKDSSGSGSK